VETRPFGLWSSDLDPVELSRAKRLRDLAWDSDGKTLVWLEGRGAQGVLVCQRPGQAPRDLNSALSVRAQVGYGGGDFAVAHGYAYFAEQSGRLYRQSLDSGPAQPLTPTFGYAAAPTPSPDGRHLVYVHSEANIDRLAIVDSAGRSWPQILVSGADFYMQPCWHPKGKSLAWIEWDHPQMPWDGCRLVLASLGRRSDGQPFIKEQQIIAGDIDEAVFQPCFSPDGCTLVYASDRNGWSNLWCRNLASGEEQCLAKDEYDVATPAWVQGLRSQGFAADGRLYFTRSEGGGRRAHSADLATGTISPVAALVDYAHIEQLTPAPKGNALACIASAPKTPARIVVCSGTKVKVRARSSSESLPSADLSMPESVSWQAEDGSHVYGLY
jgi:Tol biopolymer transport system component